MAESRGHGKLRLSSDDVRQNFVCRDASETAEDSKDAAVDSANQAGAKAKEGKDKAADTASGTASGNFLFLSLIQSTLTALLRALLAIVRSQYRLRGEHDESSASEFDVRDRLWPDTR